MTVSPPTGKLQTAAFGKGRKFARLGWGEAVGDWKKPGENERPGDVSGNDVSGVWVLIYRPASSDPVWDSGPPAYLFLGWRRISETVFFWLHSPEMPTLVAMSRHCSNKCFWLAT